MTLELLLLGVAIGLLLGTLGGGGAIFTTPALMYLFNVPIYKATSVALVVVVVAAVAGLPAHARAGNVRWKSVWLFSAIAMVAAAFGSLVSAWLPEELLSVGFALMMFIAALAMVRPIASTPNQVKSHLLVGTSAAGAGFIVGLFGVGGGFVLVPVLVLVLGFTMREATGTALAVIAVTGLAALVTRGVDDVSWALALPLAVGAVLGSVAGSRLVSHVPKLVLQRGFAALMAIVGAFVAVQAAP